MILCSKWDTLGMLLLYFFLVSCYPKRLFVQLLFLADLWEVEGIQIHLMLINVEKKNIIGVGQGKDVSSYFHIPFTFTRTI